MSDGWSVSQKEAIRERLIELCVTAIDLHEEIADSTEATEAEINKVLEALEAITKGEEQ